MYSKGFYAGKFLPFHNGHKFCIRRAAMSCKALIVILFYNSEEEFEILEGDYLCDKELLTLESRIKAIKAECAKYKHVEFVALDCAVMHKQALLDGTDTWDAETPYVMEAVGEFQAVFSSELSYDAYFKRAYPFAEHIIIDYPRINVPISATKIRGMSSNESKKWLE